MNKLILLLNHVSFIYDTLEKVQSFLSFKNLEILNHTFIALNLDYCNSLYCG